MFNTRNKAERTKLENEALKIAIGEYFTDDSIDIYDWLTEQPDDMELSAGADLPNEAEPWQPHEYQEVSFFTEHIEILAENIIANARMWKVEGLI